MDSLVQELNPLIKKYVELRSYIDGEKAALTKKMKPFAEAKDKLSAHLCATLLQNKLRNIGADAGTAFTSTKVDYKVADMAAYLQWLTENDAWESAKIEPIAAATDALAQAAFETYVEKNRELIDAIPMEAKPKFEHFLPPGVSRKQFAILKVRKNGETDAE